MKCLPIAALLLAVAAQNTPLFAQPEPQSYAEWPDLPVRILAPVAGVEITQAAAKTNGTSVGDWKYSIRNGSRKNLVAYQVQAVVGNEIAEQAFSSSTDMFFGHAGLAPGEVQDVQPEVFIQSRSLIRDARIEVVFAEFEDGEVAGPASRDVKAALDQRRAAEIAAYAELVRMIEADRTAEALEAKIRRVLCSEAFRRVQSSRSAIVQAEALLQRQDPRAVLAELKRPRSLTRSIN